MARSKQLTGPPYVDRQLLYQAVDPAPQTAPNASNIPFEITWCLFPINRRDADNLRIPVPMPVPAFSDVRYSMYQPVLLPGTSKQSLSAVRCPVTSVSRSSFNPNLYPHNYKVVTAESPIANRYVQHASCRQQDGQ